MAIKVYGEMIDDDKLELVWIWMEARKKFSCTDLILMLGKSLGVKATYAAAERILQKAKRDGLIKYVKGWWSYQAKCDNCERIGEE